MHQPRFTCLNGQFLLAEHALIPVADRGFRFGDGVFETVRLTRGAPYQWGLHMARLAAGLAALRIALPTIDWQLVARQLLAKNQSSEGFLRIAVSRGVGSMGYWPEATITPTWVIEYLPPVTAPTTAFTLWQSSMTRPSPTALPVNYKLAHGIGSTLALLEARDHGCNEALMLSSDSMLCEAASANLFWVEDGQLFTPSLATGCLTGTTRDAVMRLSPVMCHEVSTNIDTLATAHAVFISNARLGIWPVSSIQPQGRHYDMAHPLIVELAARLEADRAADAAAHWAEWAAA